VRALECLGGPWQTGGSLWSGYVCGNPSNHELSGGMTGQI